MYLTCSLVGMNRVSNHYIISGKTYQSNQCPASGSYLYSKEFSETAAGSSYLIKIT
jgi:hypothetical protein